MIISLIVATDRNGLIGANNSLPWHLPADLKHFKTLTLNKPVIMGRKTYESIGKALPERLNILVTRNHSYSIADPSVKIVHSLDAGLNAAANSEEIMIIGGSELFKEALPLASRLYLTYIDAEFAGDTYFPELIKQDWLELSREIHPADEKNPHPYHFIVYQRQP